MSLWCLLKRTKIIYVSSTKSQRFTTEKDTPCIACIKQKTEMQIFRTDQHNNRSLGIKWYTISVLLTISVLNFYGFYRLSSIEWGTNRTKYTNFLYVNRGNSGLFSLPLQSSLTRLAHHRRMAKKKIVGAGIELLHKSHILLLFVLFLVNNLY